MFSETVTVCWLDVGWIWHYTWEICVSVAVIHTVTVRTVGRRPVHCVVSAPAPRASLVTQCIASSTRLSRGVYHTPATDTTTGPGSTADWSGTDSSARPSLTRSQWENRLAIPITTIMISSRDLFSQPNCWAEYVVVYSEPLEKWVHTIHWNGIKTLIFVICCPFMVMSYQTCYLLKWNNGNDNNDNSSLKFATWYMGNLFYARCRALYTSLWLQRSFQSLWIDGATNLVTSPADWLA